MFISHFCLSLSLSKCKRQSLLWQAWNKDCDKRMSRFAFSRIIISGQIWLTFAIHGIMSVLRSGFENTRYHESLAQQEAEPARSTYIVKERRTRSGPVSRSNIWCMRTGLYGCHISADFANRFSFSYQLEGFQ